jgi:ankyrin repeat protein
VRANTNAKDKDQRTALHIAALKRMLDVARLLMESGASKTHQDGDKG